MNGISEIYIVDDIANTPACVYPESGVMLVSAKYFSSIPVEYRFFILLHEYAHLAISTTDEALADQYAFEQYAKRGYSLRAVVNCLSDTLSLAISEEHRKRAVRLLLLAQQYDLSKKK